MKYAYKFINYFYRCTVVALSLWFSVFSLLFLFIFNASVTNVSWLLSHLQSEWHKKWPVVIINRRALFLLVQTALPCSRVHLLAKHFFLMWSVMLIRWPLAIANCEKIGFCILFRCFLILTSLFHILLYVCMYIFKVTPRELGILYLGYKYLWRNLLKTVEILLHF